MSDDAHDMGAERALLGAVLLQPDLAGPAILGIPESAWWHPRHASIATVLIGRLRSGKPVDSQLVLVDLFARQGFGQETGPELLRLMGSVPTATNATYYAERIMHCAARRKLSGAATHLRQKLDQSWANGWNEPVTDFTKELRDACDLAETLDAEPEIEQPSMTLAGLLAGQDEHDWLVPGLLERGERIVLTGTEGLGKSYLISQFAVCLAAGLHPFTGRVLGDGQYRQQVLIIDCENGVSQSRRRFRKIASGIGGRDRSWLDNIRLELRPNGLNLLGADAGWLERKIALNAPDIIVVGPLYRLHYANISDELAAREIVRVLDTARTRHGCALITEAHPGHAEDGSGNRLMRPAGSSLFLRWPEFGYGIRRAKGAEGEHPDLVDVVAWRGSREERSWPKQLKHGTRGLPWEPEDPNYGREEYAA